MNKFNKILRGTFILLILIGVLVAVASCDGGHQHSLTKVDKVEATCTEAGHQAYFVCDGCDKIFKDFGATVEIDAPIVIEAEGHSIVGILGKEPTCSEAGQENCYTCTECNALFSDRLGENEIDAPIVIDPTSHDLVKTDAKPATCTESGSIEFYTCKNCKGIYSDSDGKTAITAEETVVAALGHTLTKTESKDATCVENGNVEYWSCTSCDKHYSDADAKNEIALADTVISTSGHRYGDLIVEGATTTYEPGASFNNSNLIVKLVCATCNNSVNVTDYTISKVDNLQPSDTEIIISATINNVVYTATVKIIVSHVHVTGEKHSAVAPTCTTDGTVEYYECTVCGEKFADKNATMPLDSIVDPATGHSGVKTDAKEATCTSTGNHAYWTCSCGKVFSDAACTVETTVANQIIGLKDHDTVIKSDNDTHWSECKNCDYATEKASHTGFAYPGDIPTCKVCSATTGAAAGFDGWVSFRPGIAEVAGGFVTSATHVTVNGIMASKYTFGAGAAGSESVIWTSTEKSQYHNGKYQVRIPTVGSNERYVYLYVSNDGDTAVSFRIFSENYGDKGGVDVTLGAGESGFFKYSVHTGTTIGSNINLKLLSNLESATEVTIYGYFYLGTEEMTGLQVANQNELKLSYKVGDKFDISNLILSTYIYKNDKGEVLSDGGDELYYIANNYTVSGLTNGQILTEAGTYNVTVSFGGKSLDLTVTVSGHEHNIVYVPFSAATCDSNGNTAYYVCNIDGCGQFFADAEGKTPISADSVVIAKGHNAVQLPGTAEYCTRCGSVLGGEVMNGDHWVLFRPEIAVGSGSFDGWKASYGDVDGVYGSLLTFGAGVNAGDRIQLTAWNEQGNFQTIIPNGINADVANRRVFMYFHNYGTESITIKYQNDSNSSIYCEVTIPAGGVVVTEFDHPKSGGGSNWFYLQVQNDIQSEVTVGVYGYFYLENEFDNISILNNANKLSFVEGETFSAEGLMLKTSGGIKTTFIETGFTTNFDGKVFDKAGNYTVEVYFGGKTLTYQIEVTAHKHQLSKVEGKDPVKCVEDGYEAYYRCTVAGCNELFSDETGNNKISAPNVISCHTETATLPGDTIVCSECGVGYAVRENGGLVHFTPGKPNNPGEAPYYEGISGTVNGTSYITKDYITLESGFSAIRYNIAAGTPENASIAVWCNNENRIPVKLATGGTKVILSVTNHGNQDIVISIGAVDSGNDKGSGTALIPAGQTVAVAFVVTSGADYGNNIWFAVRNEVTEDTAISIHGYYDLESDVEVGVKIRNNANKTTFKVGEKFSSEGLTLRLNNDKPVSGNAYYGYAVIYNYTTNFDGFVFDKAGSYTVVVSFAGYTVEYTIEVTE